MTQPRLSAFAHLSAENADLYRAILEVFSAAREQFRAEIHWAVTPKTAVANPPSGR